MQDETNISPNKHVASCEKAKLMNKHTDWIGFAGDECGTGMLSVL